MADEINPSEDRMSQELTMFYFTPSFAAISVLAGLGLMFCVRLLRIPGMQRAWERRKAE
jgi:hypothetical protein